MKTQILKIISNSNGINSIRLALKVMEMIGPARFNAEMFFIFLQELVHSKELIEFRFFHEDACTPGYKSNNNGIATIYFKEGTKFV